MDNLELGEALGLGDSDGDLQDVESNGLGDGSALANNDDITLGDTESRGDVSGNVLVSLLVSVVFRDKVQVFTSDNDGSVHFGGDNGTSQDLTSDRDLANKGALFVNVGALDGSLGGLETQTNVFIPSLGLSVGLGLGVGEDVRLLLESSLRLNGQFSSHLEVISVRTVSTSDTVEKVKIFVRLVSAVHR